MRVTLEQASGILTRGGLVAVPTETVYGLAASLKYEQAVQHIFVVKKRPPENPLIIHVADADQIRGFIEEFPPGFDVLADSFWPGPMTLVLPVRTAAVLSVVRAGLPTAGFRIPRHPSAQDLLRRTGPLVMPSANLSGKPSSTSPEHVEEDFGSDFPVLDGGPCDKGLESTILGRVGNRWAIFRQGALAAQDFTPVLGYTPLLIDATGEEKPLCPGRLFRHYSPKAKLLLGKKSRPDAEEAIVGFIERTYPGNKEIFFLGSLNDPLQVARNLYKILRELDRKHIETARIDTDFPEEGLWATIRERIRRAAGL